MPRDTFVVRETSRATLLVAARKRAPSAGYGPPFSIQSLGFERDPVFWPLLADGYGSPPQQVVSSLGLTPNELFFLRQACRGDPRGRKRMHLHQHMRHAPRCFPETGCHGGTYMWVWVQRPLPESSTCPFPSGKTRIKEISYSKRWSCITGGQP